MSDSERVERLLREYDREERLYERFGAEVARLLTALLESSGIQISSITNRVKTRKSFEDKIKGRDKYVTARSVTDFVGARVITFFADDVDRVASVIRNENNFEIDARNSVDKRRALQADQFGYQSLHLVASLSRKRIFAENRDFEGLKIEIQVRSLLQHTWAEIEHVYYKEERSLPASIRRRVSLLAGVLELADNEFVTVRKDAAALTMDLPICRAEGLTELVPDFCIDLPYSALPAETDWASKALILYLNTNITSRLLEHAATEVEMYVEEGGARAHTSKGVLFAASALAFSGVFPMVPTSQRESIKIRISGLRINAFQLGVSSSLTPTTIQVSVAIGEKTDRGYTSTPLTGSGDVARIYPSMLFDALPLERSTGNMPIKLNASNPGKEVAFRVAYSPQFQDAFRPADKERSSSEMSPVQGTRLMLRVNSVPTGGRVFVTVTDLTDGATPSCFQLTEADVNGHGPFRPVAKSITRAITGREPKFAESGLSGTTAYATWECTGVVQGKEAPSFAVVIAMPSEIITSIDTITVAGNLAPLSNGGTASSQSPVPIFGDDANPVAIIEFV